MTRYFRVLRTTHDNDILYLGVYFLTVRHFTLCHNFLSKMKKGLAKLKAVICGESVYFSVSL